ncbi:hypothetical protein [Burkholderia sp. BCC0405]|uniref:hypothetical protein n=1 Tax=Burkholderia sp. BCC0405 TaxID=2676298 RepID=UPI001ABA5763|nr:hypothetical protein [Burkholderia sp. BCC0405]
MLAATIVGSAVSLLKPDPVELPVLTERAEKPPPDSRTTVPSRADQPDAPWQRPRLPDSMTTAEAPKPKIASDLPPLPPAGSLASMDRTPPLPSPAPSQPSAPDIVYLGRMIRDGNTQVFFASSGGEPIVLSQGGVLDGSWKIRSISSTHVTLRHVHSGETRSITMGDRAGGGQPGRMPAQVGQGFLASHPADVQIQPVH